MRFHVNAYHPVERVPEKVNVPPVAFDQRHLHGLGKAKGKGRANVGKGTGSSSSAGKRKGFYV